MDSYDRSTMFGKLRYIYQQAAKGDDNAVDQKAVLVAHCISKFGDQATKAAIEMIEKVIKH